MKYFLVLVFAIFFISCGEKSTYVCTINYPNKVREIDTVVTTERGIKRYIKRNSENDNGDQSIIGVNEI